MILKDLCGWCRVDQRERCEGVYRYVSHEMHCIGSSVLPIETTQSETLSPWQRSERARKASAKRAKQAAKHRRSAKRYRGEAYIKRNFVQPQQGHTGKVATLREEEAARLWAERGITPGGRQ